MINQHHDAKQGIHRIHDTVAFPVIGSDLKIMWDSKNYY